MYYKKLPDKIFNTRPLVFLCGPLIDETDKKDRRNILRKYFNDFKIEINYKSNRLEVKPFALVIDKLFDEEILKEKINVTLLEEIVAACAFKNYIFLDTMSTSLELGLFSNSYAENKTTALLPCDYEFFKPTVGYFVTETIKKSHNISICKYKNRRYNKFVGKKKKYILENLVGFRANKVPLEIVNEIKKDFCNKYQPYLINMSFTNVINESDKLYYDINNNQLLILIPAPNLLYLVYKYKSLEDIEEIILEYFRQSVCYEFPRLMKIYYLVKNNKIKMAITSHFEYPISEVISNMKYLLEAIKASSSYPQKFYNLEYKELDTKIHIRGTKFYELIGFTSKDMDKLKEIISTKRKALTFKTLHINGKKRKIDMYKGNSEGYQLRVLHNYISSVLNELIELNNNSFAYKKHKSIKDCVDKHIDNIYFLKLDISNFFGSIHKRHLNKILKMIFSDNGEKMYSSNLLGNTYSYQSKLIDDWDGLESILNICFVNGRLPLGLVTSPILANIYLDFFDRRLAQEFPEVTYTRYSDDILISSKTIFDIDRIIQFVDEEMELLELKINKHKTKKLELLNVGDHVKFLGLNIVKGKNGNYITVGKKYILEVCRDVTNYLRGNCEFEKSNIIGKIEYLKFVNMKDYDSFLELFKIKTGNDFDYEMFKRIKQIKL